jgi:hypothetical protein
MSEVIYLDYNVVASTAGVPRQADAQQEREAIIALKLRGARFALSAWSAYELARSADQNHVRECCDFVEWLSPLWVSNASFLIQRELAQYLATRQTPNGDSRSLSALALNETIAQMWSTFGVAASRDESFRNVVRELKRSPTYIDHVATAASATVDAIKTARLAREDGRADRLRSTIDRTVFADRLGCAPGDERISFLMDNLASLYRKSPVLAIEDQLSEHRAKERFAPKDSDAADLQHAMAALGYCDCFVTRDKQLGEHCRILVKQLNLPCKIHPRVANVLTALK